jgi:hypothetical protein
MTVAERRAALLEWFYADEERNGWTTTQIAMQATRRALDWPGRAWIYKQEDGRLRHRAYRDLKALERGGHVTRGQTSGKATWWYA